MGSERIDARCATVVAIPARDEATTIGATVAALAAQCDGAGRPLDPRRYKVLVVANNCADGTADAARRAAALAAPLRVHVVEVALAAHEAHSGRARQLAMDAAWHRLAASRAPRRVIATTDADSVVAADWIAATRREVARGADVVGIEPVEALEDVRFYERAVRAGLRVRHSPYVRVRTSARCRGRAHVGLATQLAEWVDVGRARRAWPVDSAAFVERWGRTRRALRQAYARREDAADAWDDDTRVARLARRLCLTASVLTEMMDDAPSFDAFVARGELRQRFARRWNEARHRSRSEDVRSAVGHLRLRVVAWRERRGACEARLLVRQTASI